MYQNKISAFMKTMFMNSSIQWLQEFLKLEQIT